MPIRQRSRCWEGSLIRPAAVSMSNECLRLHPGYKRARFQRWDKENRSVGQVKRASARLLQSSTGSPCSPTSKGQTCIDCNQGSLIYNLGHRLSSFIQLIPHQRKTSGRFVGSRLRFSHNPPACHHASQIPTVNIQRNLFPSTQPLCRLTRQEVAWLPSIRPSRTPYQNLYHAKSMNMKTQR